MLITLSKSKEDNELLKSIQYFHENKLNMINNDDNILIKYLKDPKIIKDYKTNNLSLFIQELSKQIKNGNNIILPFIDPCYDLVEAFINSDDDKIEWNQIFTQLIENSFINRKNLIPIYGYFTELYSDVDNLLESDEKINNFTKIVNLWKLFYSLSENYNKNKSPSFSSFCFLGTGLEIEKVNDSSDNTIYLKIIINFLNDDFLKYVNADDDIITTKNNSIKYSNLIKYKQNNISSIELILNQ